MVNGKSSFEAALLPKRFSVFDALKEKIMFLKSVGNGNVFALENLNVDLC